MKKFFLLALILAPAMLLAGIEIPDVDPLAAFLELTQNWGAWSPVARAIGIVVLGVQLVKKVFPGFKYLRVVVVLGGILVGVLQSIASGMDIMGAVIFVMFTSGGAIAIYELFKTPLNAAFSLSRKS